MGLLDKIGRVIRSNITAAVSAAEDPEKILGQTIIDMQADVVKLRQAVAGAIAAQKRIEQQYNQSQSQADEWHRRAEMALSKNNEDLARQALAEKQTVAAAAASLKAQLEASIVQTDTLKRNLQTVESKFNAAKTKQNTLQTRARAAEANEKISEALGQINTSSALGTFDRMEEKILEKEAKSSAFAELADNSLTRQFELLEAGDSVETELQALKASREQPVLEAKLEPKAIEGGS
jgi:phage shock protein A